MDLPPNQRRFSRSAVKIEVDVVHGSSVQSGTTENLSMGGLLVRCRDPLLPGSTCRVILHLGERDSGLTAKVTGQVVRTEAEAMGIRILEIFEVESFQHLTNLVLYNSDEIEQAEQELEEFLTANHGSGAG